MADKFSLKTFFNEVKDELKKINWPTREQTIGTTTVVMVVVFLITLYLGAVDTAFSALAALIMG